MRRALGVRAIALLEGVKGAVVLLAGSGFLLLVNRDVQAIAEADRPPPSISIRRTATRPSSCASPATPRPSA